MNGSHVTRLLARVVCIGLMGLVLSTCDLVEVPTHAPLIATDSLSLAEVRNIVGQAIQQAQRLNHKVTIAVTDREGNTLAIFLMTGADDSTSSALRKARTAAFLSSNGNAFSSLTAAFITREHFPPGVQNAPAGPLFGVGFSSLPGADIQPNAGPLNDEPGGVPLYKNGVLAGGIGISGSGLGTFVKDYCIGISDDETIALGASIGFQVPDDKRGDNILIDGIRFLYTNAVTPAGNFVTPFSEVSAGSYTSSPIHGFAPHFPVGSGYVRNLAAGFDFPATAGSILTMTDVQTVIQQAAAKAAITRAAIRRPLGAAAQVFIAVADTDGTILGIWRTPDATIFSFDVAAQKARTALAFSDPANTLFGQRIRNILALPPAQMLSMTTRAIGFLAQDFFPPGIDESTLNHPTESGPLFEGHDFSYQRRLFTDPTLIVNGKMPAYGNGITIFPGGIALYKDGKLAGAIGISGDGVDQDDYIAAAGAAGFEPPDEARCDHFSYRNVQLPYVKFPRQPGL